MLRRATHDLLQRNASLSGRLLAQLGDASGAVYSIVILYIYIYIRHRVTDCLKRYGSAFMSEMRYHIGYYVMYNVGYVE